MTRTAPLERDQAPPEARPLYDTVDHLPAEPRLAAKALAHSPAALRLFLALGRAMTSLSLEPRVRELAFVTTSRLNRSALCDAFHSSVGQATGLTDSQLAGLPDHAGGHEYSDLERLVVRYATALTVSGAVDDALHRALAAHLSPQELVELALTVAGANFSNRLTVALGLAPPG